MSGDSGPLRLIDVATRAGVSLATASRSLSGGDGVSKERAEQVRRVALDMGYIANIHARSLAGGAASTIGLVVHEIGDPYFSEIASGVLGVASEQSRTVQISHAERTPESELLQVRTLRIQRVGAILIAGSGYTDPEVEKPLNAELTAFEAAGGRVAVIGRHHLAADAVLPDNKRAGHTLASHILELGHRRIGIVAGPPSLNTIVDRQTGLLETFAEAEIAQHDLAVVHAEFTREGGVQGALELLHKHPEITALIALNDVMAIGVLSALRREGIRVPEDISVAGFDDIPVAEDLGPSLTSVRIPMAEMGAQALRMALMAPASRPRRKQTGHQLIVRSSTGPA